MTLELEVTPLISPMSIHSLKWVMMGQRKLRTRRLWTPPRKPVPKASPTPVIPTVAKGGHEKDSLYWKLPSPNGSLDFILFNFCPLHQGAHGAYVSVVLRLRRHCVIKKGECSKAALDLWKTKDGRALAFIKTLLPSLG